jgi:hypothetical protein
MKTGHNLLYPFSETREIFGLRDKVVEDLSVLDTGGFIASGDPKRLAGREQGWYDVVELIFVEPFFLTSEII